MCVAYPGLVVEIGGDMAVVDVDHQTRRASTMLFPETTVGDWVVVGAGTILRILDADEAADIRGLLDAASEDETSRR